MSNQTSEKQPWVETIRPRPPIIRRLSRWIVYIVGHSLAKMDVEGRDLIPEKGPLLIVGNHFSIWEPPLMIYTISSPLNILAAGDVNWPLAQAWALFLYGYIPTNRESFKPSTIREAKRALDREEFVGIFPEAGMNPDLELRPAKPGAVYLSDLGNAPILPIGFSGYARVYDHWKSMSRPTFRIRIGKPFGPFTVSGNGEQKKQRMEEYGHEVMRRIAALLPPDWRGYYRGDPVVKEYEMYEF
ncbi:MAG: 1-acyl-sn-glycerol-3-phosphate acyltransferase [Candidatus Marinimicrobia bacterium]|nr:1-acyl-sn-glycerol-3-phosphate acyltransferase [Candidatus Neomarinimicrobiota bacterium]MCF7830298.1 1-acyl-sn-glycerol-3-phosphate acyltransferase [Candidatus Neomarinimicrobiota bacterium]MCF7882439.1 1-acyl-sn-glycerol-3-phosphate acyltransferase [Candidatus Neomarinimicrobiota bacterium]